MILNEFDDKTRFFSLFFAILNLLQIEFLFIFKFSNFRFSLLLPPSHTRNRPDNSMKTSRRLEKTFQNDHQNEQQGHSIQIPLPLHLDTSNRTNHVPLNSNSIAVSAADSRSMILSLENNVNVVSNIIRDSENLVKIKCGQCRKVSCHAGSCKRGSGAPVCVKKAPAKGGKEVERFNSIGATSWQEETRIRKSFFFGCEFTLKICF